VAKAGVAAVGDSRYTWAMAKRKSKSKPTDKKQVKGTSVDAFVDAKTEASVENSAEPLTAFERAAAKVRKFPQTPGVYLMKTGSEKLLTLISWIAKVKLMRCWLSHD